MADPAAFSGREERSRQDLAQRKARASHPESSFSNGAQGTRDRAGFSDQSYLGYAQSRQRRQNDERGNRVQRAMQRGKQITRAASTGQRSKDASLVRQGLGEAGARTGQLVGAFFGGVGAPIGKRIGRVVGENPLLSILALVGLIILPFIIFFFVAAVITYVILASCNASLLCKVFPSLGP